MSKYTVRMEADKAAHPVMLSNGNLKESGDMPDGRYDAMATVIDFKTITAPVFLHSDVAYRYVSNVCLACDTM